MKGVKVGKYTYYKSNNKGKKLYTEVNGKKIHFGSSASEHYKDKTGIWKSKDHLDSQRRANFLSRTAGIRNKSGKLTKNDPNYANYHARKVLW